MKDFGPEVASVAVLTPYKAQLALLKSAFAAQHSKSALASVEFATVDGFQVTLSNQQRHQNWVSSSETKYCNACDC